MTIGLLKDIAVKAPKGQSLLGIDVGAKTLGLAVCDDSHRVATPLQTLRRTKFTKDVEELANIVQDYEIGGFVLGLPLNMDGSEGPRCQSVRDFALELVKYPAVVGGKPWVALWDERLSTVSVEAFVDNSVGINKSKAKDRGIIDKLAAQLILQGALDYLGKS
ncbi:MAG: Holliday junction resolvase RuvX [Alphaproteobacteria bacterium PRO2]|nr:Holliday junction resolvase RuvX [Alphaproteobacteria bacterium PRO2]